MNFVLIEFIYRHLDTLTERGIIKPLSNCGPSAYEYLSYRIGVGYFLEIVMERLERSPIGDTKFKAEIILNDLINHINENQEDGVYWILISDNNNRANPLEQVIGHVFIIEKVGDEYCLVQTYVNIGGREVCGIPVCHVGKDNILTRLQNIVNLISSDEEFINWTLDHWNSWLLNLGVPQAPPPSKLTIRHRRALWAFINIGTKGILYNIRNKIESIIPKWTRTFQLPEKPKYQDLVFQKQFESYNDLRQLLTEIDRISVGSVPEATTDYLENIDNEKKIISKQIKKKFSKAYFQNL
jgi:hypothetical protein